eukprot:TRINITY_DN89558_c0_g1_i1.p1 TRINITY_DN89558_c0_g1~~TRINITY_DN89558_c0_g1_i1.p1  ORF type:complete len:148 (+),score=63.18 TRINITY_DN89558_c0_g1_i1:141-584(+)
MSMLRKSLMMARSAMRRSRAVAMRPSTAVLARYFGHGPQATEPKNPGAPDAAVPEDAQQATGDEYGEFQLTEENEVPFDRRPLTGAFGTLEAPVEVSSQFDSRAVGCVGGNGFIHNLYWFNLEAGRLHMCPRCGQHFKLKQVQPADH